MFKSREKIPVYGLILMILVCLLILGVLPCIPLCFYVYFNNKYVVAYNNNDEVLLCKYARYIKIAKVCMIVITIISVVIEVAVVVQVVLKVIDALNGTECVPCNLRG